MEQDILKRNNPLFLLTIHTLFGIIKLKIERENMKKNHYWKIYKKYIKEFLEKLNKEKKNA